MTFLTLLSGCRGNGRFGVALRCAICYLFALRFLGVRWVCPTERKDVIRYLADLRRCEALFPGHHPFVQYTVFNHFEYVFDVAAMKPIIIRKIWPNPPFSGTAMTGDAILGKDGHSGRNGFWARIDRYRIFIDIVGGLCQPLLSGLFGLFHLLGIFLILIGSPAEHM